METIRGSMEMAQCIILRTLPLLVSPGIEQKPLISPVILFQQPLSYCVCVCLSVSQCVSQKFSDGNWKFDLSLIFFSLLHLSRSHHAHRQRQTAQKAFEFLCVCVCVCVCVSVCECVCVPPLTHSAKSWLSLF